MSAILDKDYCDGAATRLRYGLDWKATPEGHNFWQAIFRRLEEYGRKIEASHPIWQVYDCGVLSAAMQNAALSKESPLVANLRAEIALLQGTNERQTQEISALIGERDDLKRKLRRADFAGWRG